MAAVILGFRQIETAFAVKDHGEFHIFLWHARFAMHVQKPRGGGQAAVDLAGLCRRCCIKQDFEFCPLWDFEIRLNGSGWAEVSNDGSGWEGGVLGDGRSGSEEKGDGKEEMFHGVSVAGIFGVGEG